MSEGQAEKDADEKDQGTRVSGFVAQVMKFGLVGVLNTAIDIGLFTVLTQVFGMYYALAHVFSYTAGVINSFIFNRGWTFHVKGVLKVRELVSFAVLNITAWGLSLCLIALFVEQLGVGAVGAKVLATIFSSTLTFFGSRFFVFPEVKK